VPADDPEIYHRLRGCPPRQLWTEEVPAFNAAAPAERRARAGLIRAVGVVFAARGDPAEKAAARAWLRDLLDDPEEKIRRYAARALPKLGPGAAEESALLARIARAESPRERAHLSRALGTFAAAATAQAAAALPLPSAVVQRAQAAAARHRAPGRLLLEAPGMAQAGLRIALRCRLGLQDLLREEVEERLLSRAGPFALEAVAPGRLTLRARGTVALGDLLSARLFASLGLDLGWVPGADPLAGATALAAAFAAHPALDLAQTWTEGVPRYRIEFIGQGHRRGAVRQLAEGIFARCPEWLNDAHQALWSLDLRARDGGFDLELRPRLHPDPRFPYREADVAAASHPPLAAALARLGGPFPQEVAWDPFCGSGVELAERARLGGVARLIGSDLDPAAIAAADLNLRAAGVGEAFALLQQDFRAAARVPALRQGVTLILTNPPLGRRVRIPDLRGLFTDLLAVSAQTLRPGGRLVFVHPFREGPRHPGLRREFSQEVDLGGFTCRLECHRADSDRKRSGRGAYR
jgi:SAM-dependent methyltransferase